MGNQSIARRTVDHIIKNANIFCALFHIRNNRVRHFFRGIKHINIGNLLATTNIIKYYNAVVIQENRIYKDIYNTPPKIHVKEIALTE